MNYKYLVITKKDPITLECDEMHVSGVSGALVMSDDNGSTVAVFAPGEWLAAFLVKDEDE